MSAPAQVHLYESTCTDFPHCAELLSAAGGYGQGFLAPAVTGQEYQCYHNLVLAHAKASVIFRSKYPPTEYPNKWIGLTNSGIENTAGIE